MGFMNFLDKILIGAVSIGLFSGFFINIFYAITMKNSDYFGYAFSELGKGILSPQLSIRDIVANFPSQVPLIGYFMILMYSVVTLFILYLIWKVVKIVLVRFSSGYESPYVVMMILTFLVYFILINATSYIVYGNFSWNPFPGWTELFKHPEIFKAYFSDYVPKG